MVSGWCKSGKVRVLQYRTDSCGGSGGQRTRESGKFRSSMLSFYFSLCTLEYCPIWTRTGRYNIETFFASPLPLNNNLQEATCSLSIV